MTPDEALEALATAAAYDRRTVGRMDGLAWSKALDDLAVRDVIDAVHLHYRDHREFVMPSDLRTLVRVVRADRVNAVLGHEGSIPAPPAELADDVAKSILWQRACVAAIADGRAEDRASAENLADEALGVERRPEALSPRPTAAIAAQVAASLRAPGTRDRDDDEREVGA